MEDPARFPEGCQRMEEDAEDLAAEPELTDCVLAADVKQQPHQQNVPMSATTAEQNNNLSMDAVERADEVIVINCEEGLRKCPQDVNKSTEEYTFSKNIQAAVSSSSSSSSAAATDTRMNHELSSSSDSQSVDSHCRHREGKIAVTEDHQGTTPSIFVQRNSTELPIPFDHLVPDSSGAVEGKNGLRNIPVVEEEEEEDMKGLLRSPVCSDLQECRHDITEDEGSDWEAPVDVDLEETPAGVACSTRSSKATWKTVRALTRWMPSTRPKHPWTQMAGHQGSFLAGERGTVLKQLVSEEEINLRLLMEDNTIKPHVPHYHGNVVKDGNCYVQLQDLLCEFNSPCVMDIKMGVRTYLEEELDKARKKPTLRRDMYEKMISIDPEAPTVEEKEQHAILKPRYMKFRDDMSSTSSLGFRIEGIKSLEGSSKDFKNTQTRDHVKEALTTFISSNTAALEKYVSLLGEICSAVQTSAFCRSHEMIGSSLLFVHDKSGKAGVWLIDFAKCCRLPDAVSTNHRSTWEPGNYEDGYLFGLDNLMSIFQDLLHEIP